MTLLNRGVVAGCALGVAAGWNFGSVGAIASELSRSYGVTLTTIGLLTTALVVTHVAIQIPAGRASDRFGAARTGTVALVVIAAGNGLALAGPEPWLALSARAVVGLGTGLAFISGSALVRIGRISGGAGRVRWRLTGAGRSRDRCGSSARERRWLAGPIRRSVGDRDCRAVAPDGLAVGRRATGDAGRQVARTRRVIGDRPLCRMAVLYAASYGLGLVLANWVVELLQRHTTLETGAAGAVGAFTLLLVVVSRPFGGWILRSHPRRVRPAIVLSVVAGAMGTVALVAAGPVWLAVIGSALVGLGAGIPFSPAFTGAAVLRPDAPAASVGFINSAANFVVLVGTPLVGLSFSLGGEGQVGFVVIAALWLAALAVVPSRRELGVEVAVR